MRPFLLVANEVVNRTLSWAAAVLLALFVAEAIWLRVMLGHWPVVYRDEPVGLVTTALEIATSLLSFGLFFGMPLWILTLGGVTWCSGLRRAAQRCGVFLGAIGTILLLGRLNVLGFAEWWLD
jgi:hypothetical protein